MGQTHSSKLSSNLMAFGLADAAVLKLEFMQHYGSFKVHGAFNRILAAAQASELPPGGGGDRRVRRQRGACGGLRRPGWPGKAPAVGPDAAARPPRSS
jgi:hypothetical protein